MTKKLILATLAGSVTQFVLGWLIYGLLLGSFMSSHSNHYEGLMKDMTTGSFMLLIFVSGLGMSFLLSFIFQRWAKFDTVLKGLTAGMLFGFFVALSYDISSFAMMNLFSKRAMLADILANTIIMGIVGAVIALVLGFRSKSASA
ncbi:MAG: hypothetical protein NTU98_09045 [Bacteroidetes bacterium]|nr:hypothetical protein [Bacteroidota bacterium]